MIKNNTLDYSNKSIFDLTFKSSQNLSSSNYLLYNNFKFEKWYKIII